MQRPWFFYPVPLRSMKLAKKLGEETGKESPWTNNFSIDLFKLFRSSIQRVDGRLTLRLPSFPSSPTLLSPSVLRQIGPETYDRIGIPVTNFGSCRHKGPVCVSAPAQLSTQLMTAQRYAALCAFDKHSVVFPRPVILECYENVWRLELNSYKMQLALR